jgi:predicted DNA-binding ribbon-helix-helix protein
MTRVLVRSPIYKRSLALNGRQTSVTLEQEYWKDLKQIAQLQNITVYELVRSIDQQRQHANLASAIRLFVLAQAKQGVLHGS